MLYSKSLKSKVNYTFSKYKDVNQGCFTHTAERYRITRNQRSLCLSGLLNSIFWSMLVRCPLKKWYKYIKSITLKNSTSHKQTFTTLGKEGMENTELIFKELALEIIHLSALFQPLGTASELDNLLSLFFVLSIFWTLIIAS